MPLAGDPGEFRFPEGEPVDEAEDGRLVSPGQFQTVRILRGQVPPLEAFHQKGDDDGRR